MEPNRSFRHSSKLLPQVIIYLHLAVEASPAKREQLLPPSLYVLDVSRASPQELNSAADVATQVSSYLNQKAPPQLSFARNVAVSSPPVPVSAAVAVLLLLKQ